MTRLSPSETSPSNHIGKHIRRNGLPAQPGLLRAPSACSPDFWCEPKNLKRLPPNFNKASTLTSRVEAHILNKKVGVKCKMTEPTKIDFHHRRISQISDFTELIEMLFPGNRNQQHAAACIFFELKWANSIVPNLAYIETKYNVTHRILQRARAKLSRLGLIEHVSYLNSRYGGQHGWKLSSRFEGALKQLAEKCVGFRNRGTSSKEKDLMLVGFMDVTKKVPPSQGQSFHEQNTRWR